MTVVRRAEFSDCRAYRYVLVVDDRTMFASQTMVAIMLNPSTADEVQDDPTVRRVRDFGQREGCGRVVVLNLFAFRATDPRDMRAQADPVGPDNDAFIDEWVAMAFSEGYPVLAAWGTHGAYRDRQADVVRMLGPMADQLQCLGTNRDGSPKHPLYLRRDEPLRFWSAPEVPR